MNLEAIEFIFVIEKEEEHPDKPMADEQLSAVEQPGQKHK